jgi:hypothetical protein
MLGFFICEVERPSEGDPSLTEGLTTTRNWENIVMATTNIVRIQTEKEGERLATSAMTT